MHDRILDALETCCRRGEMLLIANGHETTRAKAGARVDRAKLRQIDLHWHDLHHEGACRCQSVR